MAGDARNWALNLKLHDPNVFGWLEIPKTLLSETFRPPRAEFRTLSHLLETKQGNLKVHADAQRVRYLASFMVVNPVSEFVLIIIFIQGLADGTIRDHLFRGGLKTLSETIYAAEQEDFIVKPAHTTLPSIVYRDEQRLEIQSQWTSISRGLTTSPCERQLIAEMPSLSQAGTLHM